MLRWLRDNVSRFPSKRALPTISLAGDGLRFSWPDETTDEIFGWGEVSEVRTYKIDLFAYDSICLAFDVRGKWFEVCEEDSVFEDIRQQLTDLFPGVSDNWYTDVMQPPFAANETVLWKKSEWVGP